MKTLAIDIETYSSVDLIKSGVYKYVSAPDFSILLFAYAYDDEDIQIVDLTSGILPQSVLFDLQNSDVKKTAYNALFERVCINRQFNLHLPIEQWECTSVHSSVLGLPSSLERVAEHLGLADQKDKKGSALIKYFSVPCKATQTNCYRTRNLPEHDMEKWEQFKAYCLQDVAVERELRNLLGEFPMTEKEKELYHLDQKINDRGIRIDLTLAKAAIQLNEELEAEIKNEICEITGMQNANSIIQMKNWIEDRLDTTLKSVDKESLSKLLQSTEDDTIKKVLGLKQSIGKTSVKKYNAMLKSEVGGVVRGVLQFYGASRTGRWAGRMVQVHNLPRNYLSDLDTARDTVKIKSLQWFDFLYGEEKLQSTLSELVRTALVPHGRENVFVVADFSAIEARVLAWLCKEEWRLDVFKTHGKIYEASASEMFHVPIAEIGKGSPLRQKGKIAELALGYGGSTGALISMGALEQGVLEEELQTLVKSWRSANQNITKFWKTIEKACIKVVEKNTVETVACLTISMRNAILFIQLPSGRALAYQKPHIKENQFGSKALFYGGMNQTSKKWETVSTFGGKLTENIVQAIARDCLAESLFAVDKNGYDIIFHVHDEIIVECKKAEATAVLNGLEKRMGAEIPWAKGLPLKAEGYITAYYKKD
ncbi:MAG: DNA polymerase [Bacillota bacterium]